ncbi:MAG TPA: V-type ATP synthase subunit E family protein [Anaerolineales bacterium]|nr:V-type ATP synthase subunit E family protein [Anaerolineales bacterium]
MKTEAQDIEMLARAILTEAREEADQLKADAQEKADGIRKRAQEQADAERKAILDRAQEEAERLRGQSVATAQLKARSTQLTHREQLLDRVFKAVKEKLPEVQNRADYDEIAAMLLREALTQLRVHKANVRADEATLKSLKKGTLRDISKELNGEFKDGDALEEGTGVVVDAADGKLHYDNRLETRLSRLQGTLRSAVYQVLTGDKA